MQPHVKNYLTHFQDSGVEFIACEVCGKPAVDIHHVLRRSSFGSKQQAQRDAVTNLVALCRSCHNAAHGPKSLQWIDKLQGIVKERKFASQD